MFDDRQDADDLSKILNIEEEAQPRPETMDLPEQMVFGVSVFQMTSGEPIMHVHQGPGVEDVSVGELWRMVAQVKLNMELEMQSGKFIQALDRMRQAKPRIVKP